MSEWLPSIVKIESISAHHDADTLDIAIVLGDYPVITKRGQYVDGDLVSYIPVDTIVPDTDIFYFLCPQKMENYIDEAGVPAQRFIGPKYVLGRVPESKRRIKAKKIRGTFSMGLILPPVQGLNVGDSIVDHFSLTKYDEETPTNNLKVNGRVRSMGLSNEAPPKTWDIDYYDIDGLRSVVNVLDKTKNYILTEKLHGCQSSFVHDGSRFWCKSRKFYKKRDERDLWWTLAGREKLEEKLAKYPMFAFLGECVGIQGGYPYHTEVVDEYVVHKFVLFDIYDIKNRKFLSYDEVCKIADELDIERVPLLYRGPWTNKDTMYQFAEGPSMLNSSHCREGFVIKQDSNDRVQFKLIGEEFHLRK